MDVQMDPLRDTMHGVTMEVDVPEFERKVIQTLASLAKVPIPRSLAEILVVTLSTAPANVNNIIKKYVDKDILIPESDDMFLINISNYQLNSATSTQTTKYTLIAVTRYLCSVDSYNISRAMVLKCIEYGQTVSKAVRDAGMEEELLSVSTSVERETILASLVHACGDMESAQIHLAALKYSIKKLFKFMGYDEFSIDMPNGKFYSMINSKEVPSLNLHRDYLDYTERIRATQISARERLTALDAIDPIKNAEIHLWAVMAKAITMCGKMIYATDPTMANGFVIKTDMICQLIHAKFEVRPYIQLETQKLRAIHDIQNNKLRVHDSQYITDCELELKDMFRGPVYKDEQLISIDIYADIESVIIELLLKEQDTETRRILSDEQERNLNHRFNEFIERNNCTNLKISHFHCMAGKMMYRWNKNGQAVKFYIKAIMTIGEDIEQHPGADNNALIFKDYITNLNAVVADMADHEIVSFPEEDKNKIKDIYQLFMDIHLASQLQPTDETDGRPCPALCSLLGISQTDNKPGLPIGHNDLEVRRIIGNDHSMEENHNYKRDYDYEEPLDREEQSIIGTDSEGSLDNLDIQLSLLDADDGSEMRDQALEQEPSQSHQTQDN